MREALVIVHSEDAISFVSKLNDYCDGIYCSHFVEHLPIEVLDRLVQGVSSALVSGGVAVFVFPDPESIRSQLLGFWEIRNMSDFIIQS
jgi:O-antigen chain-terminating methyltransferase